MSRESIRSSYLADESKLVRNFAVAAQLNVSDREMISDKAAGLVRSVRAEGKVDTMEAFLAD